MKIEFTNSFIYISQILAVFSIYSCDSGNEKREFFNVTSINHNYSLNQEEFYELVLKVSGTCLYQKNFQITNDHMEVNPSPVDCQNDNTFVSEIKFSPDVFGEQTLYLQLGEVNVAELIISIPTSEVSRSGNILLDPSTLSSANISGHCGEEFKLGFVKITTKPENGFVNRHFLANGSLLVLIT